MEPNDCPATALDWHRAGRGAVLATVVAAALLLHRPPPPSTGTGPTLAAPTQDVPAQDAPPKMMPAGSLESTPAPGPR